MLCHNRKGTKKEQKRQWQDRGSFDRKSVDRNCVLSVDRNFHNQLTKIFDTFQVIKKFDQVPKFASYFWHLIEILIMSF
jgi:hypothetical protein